MAAQASAEARPLPRDDLAHVLERTRALWPALDGARAFVTGGTGFVGRWLVEPALRAAEEHGTRLELVLLTRDATCFAASAPRVAADPRVRLHEGDVRTFVFPDGPFTHVIHAAADADMRAAARAPELTRSTIVEGTRRTLDLAAERGVSRVLFTSSGAVYGRQAPETTHVGEDRPTAPDADGAYAEGKRAAESLCAAHARAAGLAVTVARPFALVGPHLPLDEGFAIGNFIRDAVRGGPIGVQGDGTAYRSYLYAADLAVWLWTILVRGTAGRAYNVGSEDAVTIADVARRIGRATGTEVRIAAAPVPGTPPERYVPSTARARDELGLRAWIGLDEAIARTIRWYGRHP